MVRTAHGWSMIAVLLSMSATTLAGTSAVPWLTHFEAARAQSQAQNKILLVNIHASWCVPCKRLMAGTLTDAQLVQEIGQYCIPLSLDADQDASIIRQWPITGFPTQLFIAPDGRVVNTLVGNVPVATYRSALYRAIQTAGLQGPAVARETAPSADPQAEVASRDVAPAPVRPAIPPVSAGFPPVAETPRTFEGDPSVAPSPAPAPAPAAMPEVADIVPPQTAPAAPVETMPPTVAPDAPPIVAENLPLAAPASTGFAPPPPAPTGDVIAAAPASEPSVPVAPVSQSSSATNVALAGYCPVCMITRAELVRGLPGESHVYKGRTYQFVSAAEKQVFMADPTRYLPAEDGYCVVTWAEQHRREAGNIELPALFGDYLYLFAKEEARQKFLRDPERYVDPNGRARRIPLQTFRGDASNVR